MPRWPLRGPAGLAGGAHPAGRKGGPQVTHFRLAPSGLPGTPTLLTTTISGARAAQRRRPRPPPACHLPPGRACGDCLAAFWRAGRACGPSPTATAPPRDTERASAAEQEGSGPRRRGAGPAFLPSGSLRSEPQPCFPQAGSRPRPSFLQARSSVAALLVSSLLSGRRLFFKLALRPFPPPSRLAPRHRLPPPRLALRPPPLSRAGCAGARVGPCCVSARGSPQGRGAERSAAASPSRPPQVVCPPSSAVRSLAEPRPGGDSCAPGPRACRHHRHRPSLVPAMAFVSPDVLVTDLDPEY